MPPDSSNGHALDRDAVHDANEGMVHAHFDTDDTQLARTSSLRDSNCHLSEGRMLDLNQA